MDCRQPHCAPVRRQRPGQAGYSCWNGEVFDVVVDAALLPSVMDNGNPALQEGLTASQQRLIARVVEEAKLGAPGLAEPPPNVTFEHGKRPESGT